MALRVMFCTLTGFRTPMRRYGAGELAHYATATTDLEFRFSTGWDELWGIAHRGDYDLVRHANASASDFSFQQATGNGRIIPHVVEPALGSNRLVLALLTDAFVEEDVVTSKGPSKRTVLKLDYNVAPIRASLPHTLRTTAQLPFLKIAQHAFAELAILPLLSSKDELVFKARHLASAAAKRHRVDFDVSGSIGKRYRRQDESGTPFCITVDYDTLEDDHVTVRMRDTMHQARVPIDVVLNGDLRTDLS